MTSRPLKYAAFLRGINVGGHRVTNDELRSHFEALGFADVKPFRASGNVVFASAEAAPASISERIAKQLAEALGYPVATFLRTAVDMRALARRQPFTRAQAETSTGKLQVALLSQHPSARARREVLELASPADPLVFGGRELYWLPSGGMSDSALDLKAIERLLGQMTLRTKNTIEQMTGLHFTE